MVRVGHINGTRPAPLTRTNWPRRIAAGEIRSAPTESIARKEAHARAMAEVLTAELGIKCYADSRLD